MKMKTAKSLRRDVWENMMVLGVNELLRKGLICLEPVDEWKKVEADFKHPDGTPCRAWASDIGFGELAITVVYDPNQNEIGCPCPPMRRDHGRAAAYGWIERKDGKHLQTLSKIGRHFLYVDTDCKDSLASTRIEAEGFERGGKFYI